MPKPVRWDKLSVPVDAVDMAMALDWAEGAMRAGRRALVITPNPEIVMAAWRNRQLATIIDGSDLSLPDGIGLVWASRLLGGPLGVRVPGVEFIEGCLDLCAANAWAVFFLGGQPGVAAEAAERAVRRWPGLVVAGTHHGYFGREEEPGLLEAIRDAKPRFLAVGMGHPRQELWLAANLPQLDGVLAIACGGSLDVLAGRVSRAPLFFRRTGLEWLYRVLSNPRARLGRVGTLMRFGLRVVGHRITGRPFPGAGNAG